MYLLRLLAYLNEEEIFELFTHNTFSQKMVEKIYNGLKMDLAMTKGVKRVKCELEYHTEVDNESCNRIAYVNYHILGEPKIDKLNVT